MQESSYFENITKALISEKEEASSKQAFYATEEFPVSKISVSVEGIGPIDFPISSETLEKLMALSHKAQFGLGEKTLLDETVRNTYEIPADKLQVTVPEDELNSLLEAMRDSMGLDEKSRIVPHLYNLLLYAPGHFFQKHQDSEKLENMIATLVMVLPSPHIGGNLIIEQGSQSYHFSSENVKSSTVKCVAFYADCDHEIKIIKEGYRIALTYNLVLETDSDDSWKKEAVHLPLKTAVQDYFEKESKPDMLVYLLDHSYSEHSLRWNLLKGVDRANGQSLFRAAQALGLRSYLTLSEIRKSWSAYDEDEEPDFDELIDEEVTLSYWIDENNQTLNWGSHYVSSDEVCWTTDTQDLEPYDSEYEGYTGNAGNTMDYWYRRAAIVICPESTETFLEFELNYSQAMENLKVLLEAPGNESKVAFIAENALKYVIVYRSHKEETDFKLLVRIALYLKDSEKAFPLLSDLGWENIEAKNAFSFSLLQKQYGVDWCLRLLKHWLTKSYRGLLTQLDQIILKLNQNGIDFQFIQLILDAQMDLLVEQEKSELKYKKPAYFERNLGVRLDNTEALLTACAIMHYSALSKKLSDYLVSCPELYSEISLAQLLLRLKSKLKPEEFAEYETLQNRVLQLIEEQLKNSQRAPDDWSIVSQLRCACEHCRVVKQFLKSETEVQKVWPIVMEVRKHVMDILNDMALPVELSVEKKGSPHKLVMVKTPSLHIKAQQRFEALNRCLTELTGSGS